MKILYIHGDSDYAAMTYEEEIGKEKALEIIGEVYGKDIELLKDDDTLIYGKLLDVGEVSKTFIDFIRDHEDYDDAKHSNWYEV